MTCHPYPLQFIQKFSRFSMPIMCASVGAFLTLWTLVLNIKVSDVYSNRSQ